jgi:hypothetical protein
MCGTALSPRAGRSIGAKVTDGCKQERRWTVRKTGLNFRVPDEIGFSSRPSEYYEVAVDDVLGIQGAPFVVATTSSKSS